MPRAPPAGREGFLEKSCRWPGSQGVPTSGLRSKGRTPCLGPWPCLSRCLFQEGGGARPRCGAAPQAGASPAPTGGLGDPGRALPSLCGPGQACLCVQACDGRGQSGSEGDTASLCYPTHGGAVTLPLLGKRRGRQLRSARRPGHAGPLPGLPSLRLASRAGHHSHAGYPAEHRCSVPAVSPDPVRALRAGPCPFSLSLLHPQRLAYAGPF